MEVLDIVRVRFVSKEKQVRLSADPTVNVSILSIKCSQKEFRVGRRHLLAECVRHVLFVNYLLRPIEINVKLFLLSAYNA